MSRELIYPADWVKDVEDAILHPEQFKFAGVDPQDPKWHSLPTAVKKTNSVLIRSVLKEKYDLFHSRATAHSLAKGQHEAAAILNFYVIWLYKLWRAEYDCWQDYLDDVCSAPFSVSASTINHKNEEILKLLNAGAEIRRILIALGNAPTAAGRLADVPLDQLPAGGINQALETVSELSPIEANRHVDDMEMKSSFHCNNATYVSGEGRIYCEFSRTDPGGKRHWFNSIIMDVESKEHATWFFAAMRLPGTGKFYK